MQNICLKLSAENGYVKKSYAASNSRFLRINYVNTAATNVVLVLSTSLVSVVEHPVDPVEESVI
jgi:hypothetical protein